MPGCVDGRTQGRHVAGDATGGVGMNRKHGHDLVRGVGAQGLLHCGQVDRMPLHPRCADHAATHGFGLLGPALGEMPRARHQHAVARPDKVGDHGLPGAVPVGGVHEHIGGFGLQQATQAALDGSDGLAQAGIGHVHRLAGHGLHHLQRNMAGAG